MRTRRPGFSDAEVVFSNKSLSLGFFHPIGVALDSSTFKTVRVALDASSLGNVSLRIGYQVSDDGVTWPTSTTAPTLLTLPAAVTTEGVSFPATFEDISSGLTKRYVRFGVWVLNSSGALVELAVVAIRIETRNC